MPHDCAGPAVSKCDDVWHLASRPGDPILQAAAARGRPTSGCAACREWSSDAFCPSGNRQKSRRLFCPTSQARLAKIFLFPNDRNYDLKKPSRPHEGRFAIVTIRGAGCDGRGRAARRAERRVRSSRVVLSPRRWGQANGLRFRPCGRNAEVHSRRRLTSPVLRGERGAAVKPLRRECRSDFGVPVLACVRLFCCARKAVGAACTRHSLRPLFSRGTPICKGSGGIHAARTRNHVF